MVVRNHAEYAYEGQEWQKAPEEHDFPQRNGKLVHPLYVWAEQEEAAGSESDASLETNDSEDSDDC